MDPHRHRAELIQWSAGSSKTLLHRPSQMELLGESCDGNLTCKSTTYVISADIFLVSRAWTAYGAFRCHPLTAPWRSLHVQRVSFGWNIRHRYRLGRTSGLELDTAAGIWRRLLTTRRTDKKCSRKKSQDSGLISHRLYWSCVE